MQNVLEALLSDETLAAGRRADHDPSLVVEVGEHDEDSSTLLAESVLDGHLDIIKGDEGSSGGGRLEPEVRLNAPPSVLSTHVGSLDRLGLDTLTTLNQDDSEAILGPAANGEAVPERQHLYP